MTLKGEGVGGSCTCTDTFNLHSAMTPKPITYSFSLSLFPLRLFSCSLLNFGSLPPHCLQCICTPIQILFIIHYCIRFYSSSIFFFIVIHSRCLHLICVFTQLYFSLEFSLFTLWFNSRIFLCASSHLPPSFVSIMFPVPPGPSLRSFQRCLNSIHHFFLYLFFSHASGMALGMPMSRQPVNCSVRQFGPNWNISETVFFPQLLWSPEDEP